MEYQLREAVDHINREEPNYMYSCVCCNKPFDPGYGAFCKDTANNYCYYCIALGKHFKFYRDGEMTDRQILEVEKTFKPL